MAACRVSGLSSDGAFLFDGDCSSAAATQKAINDFSTMNPNASDAALAVQRNVAGTGARYTGSSAPDSGIGKWPVLAMAGVALAGLVAIIVKRRRG